MRPYQHDLATRVRRAVEDGLLDRRSGNIDPDSGNADPIRREAKRRTDMLPFSVREAVAAGQRDEFRVMRVSGPDNFDWDTAALAVQAGTAADICEERWLKGLAKQVFTECAGLHPRLKFFMGEGEVGLFITIPLNVT